MGTVLFKEGELAQSRYHLEKSIKEGFVVKEVLNNLAVVKNQLNVRETVSDNSLTTYVNFKLLETPSAIYMSVFLLFTVMALAIWLKSKKWASSLSFLAIGVTVMALQQFYVKNQELAISLSEAKVYEGPSKVFPNTLNLPEGMKVLINKSHKDWYFIEYPENMTGWVNKSDIGIL
ncbi:MAG: hypothetical protein ACI9QD_000109 [Thermoproteota archaeon]|jgi:hypothetical protein